MRRFEFDDGKSKKFWEIVVDGQSYTVRYGRLGTTGQTNTKVFGDASVAQKKADAAIASKVKKGYAEVEAAPVQTDPIAELLDRLRADPDDADAWGVLADRLQADDDPRGELISVQRALAATPDDPTLKAREAELIEKHQTALFGELREGSEEREICTFTWRNGYWHRVKVASSWDTEDVDGLRTLGLVLRHPSAALLHTLEVGMLEVDGEVDFGPAVDVLVKHGHRPGLRKLHLGAFEYPDDTEISWTQHGSVERLGPLLPHLEELHLTGGGIELGALQMPSLRKLKLETGGLPVEPTRVLGSGAFPALEELEIYFGDDHYGAACSADDVAPILGNTKGLPALRRLGLKNAMIANDINGLLANAAILPQLTHLDLSMGTMTDEGAEVLLAAMPKLQHLERLDVSENFLSEAMEGRLRAAFPGELVGGTDKDDEGGEWFYTSVAE
jgi:predicted DNA-binding WGR domain protein